MISEEFSLGTLSFDFSRYLGKFGLSVDVALLATRLFISEVVFLAVAAPPLLVFEPHREFICYCLFVVFLDKGWYLVEKVDSMMPEG